MTTARRRPQPDALAKERERTEYLILLRDLRRSRVAADQRRLVEELAQRTFGR